MRRFVRAALTLVVTALAVTYILLKIDLGKTIHILGSASVPWLGLSLLLALATILPMAWRWQRLLRTQNIDESLVWLTRAYLVSFAVGQLLPTAVGGDASRIFETSRRQPRRIAPVTGSVIVERALGAVVTLVLAGVGFLLALGRYPIGAYLWVELGFVFAMLFLGVLFFSRWSRRRLASAVPVVRWLRIEGPARAVYEGVHGYRDYPGTLLVVCGVSLLVQLTQIIGIYVSAKAVGIRLSPLPFVVLGPLLFLVTLLPISINGLGVREAFFVSFLGRLHVGANVAFACGFLFFLVTVALSLPGAVVILWESLRPRVTRSVLPRASE